MPIDDSPAQHQAALLDAYLTLSAAFWHTLYDEQASPILLTLSGQVLNEMDLSTASIAWRMKDLMVERRFRTL